MDLSLEFPLRFHRKIGSNKSNGFCKLEGLVGQYCSPKLILHVHFEFFVEMLGQFMQTEKLEGKIYACEECNSELSDAMTNKLVNDDDNKLFAWLDTNNLI